MKYLTKRIICAAGCLLMLTSVASAHPGQTDADGGHWDNDTGEYHYHHGYPAHQHTNGICPYDYDDQTGWNSGTSGSTSGESISTNAENGETLYNGGLGDDGTYETAWNLGYQHAIEDFCDRNEDSGINFGELATKLCHENALVGSTPYSVRESSYNDAYESGWNQAADDVYSSINEALSQYVNGVTQDELLAKYQEGHAVGLSEGKRQPVEAENDTETLKLALGLAAALIVLLICGWLYAVKNVRRSINIFFRDMRTLARMSQDGTIRIDDINRILRSINEEQMR